MDRGADNEHASQAGPAPNTGHAEPENEFVCARRQPAVHRKCRQNLHRQWLARRRGQARGRAGRRTGAVIGIGALLSVLALTQGLGMGLLVVTVLYAFLTIQVDGSSILDFLRRAACFLFLRQQYYEWRQDL